MIIPDLPSLPHITIPVHCRALATNLGVCVQHDLRTCINILQLLANEKNTNVELYIQCLTHFQLYVRQQYTEFDSDNLLLSCQLYLPDLKNFCSLKNILILPDSNDKNTGMAFYMFLNISIYK